MKKLIRLLFISLLFACNTGTQQQNNATDTTQVSGSQERTAAPTTRDISNLLYTEAQAKTQYANTPNVKKPLDTFWFNIQPNYAVNGQLHDIEESIEYAMLDIVNNRPPRKYYSWDYFTPTGTLVGQYLYVEDRNKIIVPQLQKDLDTIYAHLNKEFGFYVYSEQKNITGYYQKATIRKSK